MPATRVIRPHHYVAYGATDMMGSGATMVVSGWLLFFYTTFCGLNAIEATSIFAIARIFDAVASPVLGHISDNFGNTALGRRFGRRRFFLLIGIPLLPVFALMWVSGQTYLYYLLTYVVFDVIYAMILIPYETLAAEMTDDYQARARFAGARILVGQIAAVVSGILPRWIVEVLGRESVETFFYLGCIFSALFVIAVSFTYWFTWERNKRNSTKEDGTNTAPILAEEGTKKFSPGALYRNMLSTIRVRAFRLHLGLYLGGYLAIDIFNAAFTYFVVFALGGNVAIAAGIMATMAAAQFVAVSVFIPLTIRIHPAPAYRIAALLYSMGIVSLAAIFIMRPANALDLAYACAVLCGLGRGGLIYIPWNTYNYIADVDEIITGQRREGVFAGVMTMVRKAAQAGAVACVGVILNACGFASGAAHQPTNAINAIVLVQTIGSLILLAIGVIISIRFSLNRHTHAQLMTEIARFKSGENTNGQASNAEAQRVVEQLTGWPYASLWKRDSVKPGKRIRRHRSFNRYL
jgi:oligogalacturonide transporter